MIDKAVSSQAGLNAAQKKISYTQNSRTAGRIPVWSQANNSNHVKNYENKKFEVISNFSATSPSNGNHVQAKTEDKSFGFFDLLDIINPLQHIPVVGYLYREITGDQIHPISQIIGGGIFGGPMGAGLSLVKTVVEDGIGQPVETTIKQAFRKENPKKEIPQITIASNQQENQTPITKQKLKADDLPVSLLAFTDQNLSHGYAVTKKS